MTEQDAASGIGPVVPSFRRAGTAALFSRGLVVASGLVSSTLLPLALDQTSVGQFFLAQLVIGGLATFAQLGLTFAIPSYVTNATARHDLGRARRLAISIGLLCLCAGTIAAGLAWFGLPLLGDAIDMNDLPAWLLAVPVIAAIIPLTSLTAILVELFRAVHAIRWSANLAGLGSAFTASYLVLVLTFGWTTTLQDVLMAGLLGWGTCVVIGIAVLTRLTRGWNDKPAREPVHMLAVLKKTAPNLATTLLLFGLANFDILMLSSLGAMEDVAQYGIALRFSTLLVIPLGIANSAFAPLGVQARTTGQDANLRNMLAKLVLASAAAAALLYAGFAVFGHTLISLWNSAYRDAYWLTLILGFGNVLHACGGAAGMILMVWGDQGKALRITAITGVVTVLLGALGLHFGGVLWLAFAAAFGNVLQVGWFVLRVRQRFGLDPSLAAGVRSLPRFNSIGN